MGLICVIAMGNDGIRRVPSPASADSSIAVGAIDERDTADRENDVIASYSNWGPRVDDGDDDDWDEMNPMWSLQVLESMLHVTWRVLCNYQTNPGRWQITNTNPRTEPAWLHRM